MGYELSKPRLRAELENDLKAICEGVKQPETVLRSQVEYYKRIFQEVLGKKTILEQEVLRNVVQVER